MLSSRNRSSYENLERLILLLQFSMKIEARYGFLAFLDVGPLFAVVVRRIDDERDLIHVTCLGIDVRPVLEFEDELVRIPVRHQNHARLIVRGAVVRRHQIAAVRMKDGHHLVGDTFIGQPMSAEPSAIS